MNEDTMTAAAYRQSLGLSVPGAAQPRGRPEEALQLAVMDYVSTQRLEQRGKCAIFHVANEKGGRSYAEMAVRKALGVRAGVADLIVMRPGGKAAAIELKAPGNYPTKAQRQFHADCQRFGWPYFVVRSLEQFEDALVALGVLRPAERIIQEPTP